MSKDQKNDKSNLVSLESVDDSACYRNVQATLDEAGARAKEAGHDQVIVVMCSTKTHEVDVMAGGTQTLSNELGLLELAKIFRARDGGVI